MRELVTIRKIADLVPIEGADAIELAKIDGWQCVVKIGEFKVGDPCLYFEIDSFIPLLPQLDYLKSRMFKRMGEQEGMRVKTVKLRGQLSQGLALPVSMFVDHFLDSKFNEGQELCEFFYFGADLTDFLGVQKYEAPIPTELSGNVKGNFPTFIPKTDQDRCQNIAYKIFEENKDAFYEVSMKMDGTSFTAYQRDDIDGVCGRNWELTIDEHNVGNTLIRMYQDSGLQAVLCKLRLNLAVQGELMGPGIQKNREQFKAHKLFIFDMFDIDKQEYLAPKARLDILGKLQKDGLNMDMVQHVPIIAHSANLYDTLGITTTDHLLTFAEGKSVNHPIREGLVFKRKDGKFSFKCISNHFLLKSSD